MPNRLIKDAVEDELSVRPKDNGRWPFVKGMKFMFDLERESGDRMVLDSFYTTEGEQVDHDKVYSCTLV